MIKMKISSFLVAFGTAFASYAQTPFFADGYHGGIYGHYPLWQTQFMIDKLNECPDWKINLEIEPETWDSVKLFTPEAYDQFKKMTDNRRIAWTNPTYAQPYCFNISGESIIRQFEYGMKKIHRHFPSVSFYVYAVEEPCFTSALPQILRSFGFRAAVLKNPDTCWGGYVDGFGNGVINWTGSDGTSLPAVPRYACEKTEQNSTWQTASWNNSSEYLQACAKADVQNPVGMCYQDAGWKNGPWLGSGEKIKNNSRYITWNEYFTEINKGKITEDWHLSQENIRVALMWGSQVLQRIARQVRHSENVIVQAEKIAAMRLLEYSEALPDTLIDEAWRTLLLAQHHDAWIVPCNRMKNGRTWAEEVACWTENTDGIASQIIRRETSADKGNEDKINYLKIYNTLPFARRAVISEIPFEDMQIRPFSIMLPPFGYKTVRLDDKLSPPEELSEQGIYFQSDNECVMENDFYQLTFDLAQGGIIKSLIAKQLNGKEFVDEQSAFGFGELRGRFYEKERFISNRERAARLTVIENNALRKKIRIESQIDGHPCRTTVTLLQSSEIIDFSLNIEWKSNAGIGEYRQSDNDWRENRRAFYDDRFKLNLLFPARLHETVLYRDAPFDLCKSGMKNTFYNTWDSIKNNVVFRRIDLMQADSLYGLALFTDHATSYSYGDDFPLGLTLQYSGIGLWGVNYALNGPLCINYALLPHGEIGDKAGTGAKNTEWNEAPIVVALAAGEPEERSFLQFSRPGYEISACKPEGDKAIILRIFNSESDGQPVKINFNFPVKSCTEIALNGEKQSVFRIKNNNVELAVPRFGIKTLKIEKQDSDFTGTFTGHHADNLKP